MAVAGTANIPLSEALISMVSSLHNRKIPHSDDQEGLVRSPITAFQHTCNQKECEEREERGEGERNDILMP